MKLRHTSNREGLRALLFYIPFLKPETTSLRYFCIAQSSKDKNRDANIHRLTER